MFIATIGDNWFTVICAVLLLSEVLLLTFLVASEENADEGTAILTCIVIIAWLIRFVVDGQNDMLMNALFSVVSITLWALYFCALLAMAFKKFDAWKEGATPQQGSVLATLVVLLVVPLHYWMLLWHNNIISGV